MVFKYQFVEQIFFRMTQNVALAALLLVYAV